MPEHPLIRILRGCGGLIANLLAAIIGVGLLKTLGSAVVKLFTHSRASIILTEWIGSIVFAALAGHSVERRWKSRTARWIWVPAVLSFLVGLVGLSRRPWENLWLTFSGIGCVYGPGMPCIHFTVFTVPLVRASAYSLAAFLVSRSQGPAEIHPVLSHIFSGLFLVGLPKRGEPSEKAQAVTKPDKPE